MNKSIVFVGCGLLVCLWSADAHAASATTATSSSMERISTTTVSHAATTTSATTTLIAVHNRAAVEKRVREVFASTSDMVDIARCESNFRQFTDAGKPFRGGADGGMIGVFQFNERVHTVEATALGFDLATLEGNLGYAKHIYDAEGATPWASCEPAPVTNLDAQTTLKIELMTKLIGLLQELLKLELAGR